MPDYLNINHFVNLAVPDDVVQWMDEPTVKLRWNNGILEQMHWRRGFNPYGMEVKRHEEWRPVPRCDVMLA